VAILGPFNCTRTNDMRSTHRLPLLLSAGIAGLSLAAMPLGFDGSTVGYIQAWAGNENGHGHAGEHGSGNASGAGENRGSTASELGALNAAHASDTALANASPNSRVGKIAAYKEAELAAKAAAADVAAADQAVADAQAKLDAALAANADDDPLNDVDQATIDGLTQGVADAQAAAETADATAAAAQDEADAALVNASNKDITDEDGNVFSNVRDAVNDLLGIN
jgi:hypothetical protein